MFIIQISKFTPFWNNSDVNFPDNNFDNPNIFAKDSPDWDIVSNGSIEWTSSNNAWVQIDVVQFNINYLRVWDDYKEQMYYFFVMDFFDISTKTCKLTLELDIWGTYHQNVLNELKNENPIVYFNKKHMNRYTILDNISLQPDIPVDFIISESFETELSGYVGKDTPYSELDKWFSIDILTPIISVDKSREFASKYRKLLSDYNIIDTGSTLTFSHSITQIQDPQEGLHHTTNVIMPDRTYYAINYWNDFSFNNPSTYILRDNIRYSLSFELYDRAKLNNIRVSTKHKSTVTCENNVSLHYFNTSPKTMCQQQYTHIAIGVRDYPLRRIQFGMNYDTKKVITTITCHIKGTTKGAIPIPQATSYALDFNGEQQFLMNDDDMSNLGDNKINTDKINFTINKRKYDNYQIFKKTGIVTENWESSAENKFAFKNGYYMYGIVKFPYTAQQVLSNLPLTKFLMSDISNNLFIYLPILNNNVIVGSFSNNTRAFIEGSFGDNLVGVITSPISPLTISQKAVTISKLFGNNPPYSDPQYDNLSGFISASFNSTDRFVFNKTPFENGIYSLFTPPTTEEEKWDKKLTTLSYECEPLLVAPQYLEYYITNGINEISTNNYVTPIYADKNYIDMSWGFSPISSIVYLNGLYDINRFEPQKNVITFTGNLPSNSSTYNQWILENAASINMGLASARDSANLQRKYGALNAATGLMSFARGGARSSKGMTLPGNVATPISGITTPNGITSAMWLHKQKFSAPNAMSGSEGMIQGVKDVVKGAYQIEKANVDYKNYQRQISGKNSDAMTKSTLITTDDASYINTFASLAPLSVMFMGLKPNDCNAVWWNAHINGYNTNRTFNFNEYDNRTYFNYFEVTDISPSILRVKNIPMIYKDWFISKFEDGIRLWKSWFDYKLDNKEVFVDKIDNVVIPIKGIKNEKRNKNK